MEHNIIKHQQGYLLIIAVIAIVIIGFIASILARMYTTATGSTINSLQSDAAFYIAKAGLEIARRDLIRPGSQLNCSDINSNTAKYVNSCYPPGATKCVGYFTVTGVASTLTGLALANNIDATSTTIRLNNTSNLASPGIIVIDNEAIWYTGSSGNKLQNVMRGAFNTTRTAHTASASTVTHNLCTLTATASVPTVTNPDGKRVLQAILWKDPNVHCLGTFPGCISPAFIAAGGVSLRNASIIKNPSIVDANATNFKGSTIACGGSIATDSTANFKTYVGNNLPASEVSDYTSNILGDIDQNDPNINSSSLWGFFFNQNKSDVKNNSTTMIITGGACNNYSYGFNPNDIANSSPSFAKASAIGGTVWVSCNNNSNLRNCPSNGITIGSKTHPATFIMGNPYSNNQDAKLTIATNNITVYGLTYFTNGTSISASSPARFTFYGLRASENPSAGGDSLTAIFDYNVLASLNFMTTPYNKYYMSREVIN